MLSVHGLWNIISMFHLKVKLRSAPLWVFRGCYSLHIGKTQKTSPANKTLSDLFCSVRDYIYKRRDISVRDTTGL